MPSKKKAARLDRAKKPKKSMGAKKVKTPVSRAAREKGQSKRRKRQSKAEPFPMRLTGMMSLKYRALLAELSEAEAVLRRTQDLVANEQSKKIYQPLLILLERQAEEQLEVKRRVAALIQHQKAVAAKFNVPLEQLHEYTIDPETGVMLHDPPKKEGSETGS